ncbi:MAG: hypothetical protein J5819_06425 [Eubacterium sp.]|nr:hypothetical protein [Eubacterium sp.]
MYTLFFQEGETCQMDAQSALELFSKNLLTYDSHVGHNDMFYYNLPYERNYELTNSISITPVSGNVIKFYQYQLGKPVRIFTDTVDTTAKPVASEADSDEEFDESSGEFAGDEFYDEDGNLRELSEEEMAALLTADNSSSDDASPEEEVYEKEPANWAPEEF